MQKKIIGILIVMLFVASAVFPVAGIIDSDKNYKKDCTNNSSSSSFSNKYAWSGEGHGLNNIGVISLIVPSYFPVYLSFKSSSRALL